MIANLWMGFDDRAQSAANPGDDDAPRSNAYRALGDPSVRSVFRQDNPSGPRSWELWSLYYEVETAGDLRNIRNDLRAEYPGQIRTIGAWWWDGRRVETFTLHASILEYMPDVVTYDLDGIEVSRARPTAPTDVNLGLGQTRRVF